MPAKNAWMNDYGDPYKRQQHPNSRQPPLPLLQYHHCRQRRKRRAGEVQCSILMQADQTDGEVVDRKRKGAEERTEQKPVVVVIVAKKGRNTVANAGDKRHKRADKPPYGNHLEHRYGFRCALD